MKNFWKFAQSLGLLCVVGAVFMFVLNTIAIIGASFGFTRPFRYFQFLRIPLWSVILPVIGILALLPLALREAFTYESPAEEKRVFEPVNWRRTVNKWRSRLHLRPV